VYVKKKVGMQHFLDDIKVQFKIKKKNSNKLLSSKNIIIFFDFEWWTEMSVCNKTEDIQPKY